MSEDHAVRIAVAASGNQLSSTWRVWSDKNDVYLATRSLSSVFKTSLHASGLFRHAFVPIEDSDLHQGPGRDRAVSKWCRKIRRGPSYSSIIPGAGLAPIPNHVPDKNTIMVSPFAIDDVGYISVSELTVDAAPKSIRFDQTEARVLDSWNLPRGTGIYVTWHTCPASPEQLSTLMVLPKLIEARGPAPSHAHRSEERYRAFFIVENTDGIGRLLDVGIKPIEQSQQGVGECTQIFTSSWES
jgi:hypothetical protein